MKYKYQQRINNILPNKANITENYVTKQCIVALVQSIPLEDLKKVFTIEEEIHKTYDNQTNKIITTSINIK